MLCVPAESVDTYKASDTWSKHVDKIKAISTEEVSAAQEVALPASKKEN